MAWSNAGWQSDEGGWYKNKAAGGGGTTTWNPSDKSVNITLSNGNLTASDGASGFNGVRGIASHSTGLYYYEIVVSASGNTGLDLLGIGNASASLVDFTGDNNNSIGYGGDGKIWLNGGNPTGSPIQSYVVGDIIGVATDMTHIKMWFKNITQVSGWNNDVIGNQNPATNTGGISFSTMAAGPWFPQASLEGATSVMTANFGATAYTGTAPSGFGNW